MVFLVKALFRWNKSLKNDDISILNNFLAIFFGFFLYIEKFCQVLSTCQITEGAESLPPPPPSHTNLQTRPACLGLNDTLLPLIKNQPKRGPAVFSNFQHSSNPQPLGKNFRQIQGFPGTPYFDKFHTFPPLSR